MNFFQEQIKKIFNENETKIIKCSGYGENQYGGKGHLQKPNMLILKRPLTSTKRNRKSNKS